MSFVFSILIALQLAAVPSEGYVSLWEKDALRFDIIQGFLKELVVEIMYDESNPLPGGAFAVSFSFNCHDFSGKPLGCGIYIDNQWGGNKDEQYYFLPLDYEIIDNDSFRLKAESRPQAVTNKGAPAGWPYTSVHIRNLLKEMCKGHWNIRHIDNSYMGTSQWILERSDDPQRHRLYYNYMK